MFSCKFAAYFCRTPFLNNNYGRLLLNRIWLFLQHYFGIRLPLTTSRSSCPEVLCKLDLLRNFAKFPGKHLCQSLFFVAGLRHEKSRKITSFRARVIRANKVVVVENLAKIHWKMHVSNPLFKQSCWHFLTQGFSGAFCKFSKTHLFYRTLPYGCFWKLFEITGLYSIKLTYGRVCFFLTKIDVSRYQILDLVYIASLDMLFLEYLIYFWPIFPCCNPWKQQKTIR